MDREVDDRQVAANNHVNSQTHKRGYARVVFGPTLFLINYRLNIWRLRHSKVMAIQLSSLCKIYGIEL